MSYRDDRQALELQLAELERENDRLQKELSDSQADAKKSRAKGRERRRAGAMKGCPACGGSMLPAAVFAGSNDGSPIPIRFSTLRFSSPTGGFTDSAPVRARVCASCGFIFHYIDMPKAARRDSGERLVIGEHVEVHADADGGEDEPESSEPESRE
ncbi:MAG: hypothetical protein JKY37_05065 [Nannocystaceae bacterium]|nr:hypothetical protein [Nannocystaceae bacterium]